MEFNAKITDQKEKNIAVEKDQITQKSSETDTLCVKEPIQQAEFQFKVPSAEKILRKKMKTTPKDTVKTVANSTRLGCSSSKRGARRNLIKARKMACMIPKCILWPNDKSQAIKIFARRSIQLQKRVDKLVNIIKTVEEDKDTCTCRGLIAVGDRIGYHQKIINAKFSLNANYPDISIDWLRARASLTTREFISEIIRKISNSIRVDQAGIYFIIEKVKEKYSEFEEMYRNCNIFFAKKHIIDMYTTSK